MGANKEFCVIANHLVLIEGFEAVRVNLTGHSIRDSIKNVSVQRCSLRIFKFNP